MAKIIPWLMIDGKIAPYPVVNERVVRATAWIMFLIGINVFWYTIQTWDFSLLYPTVTLFWIEFAIRIFVWSHWAPLMFIGNLFVWHLKPERVGAVQKTFAASIWLVLATLMLILRLGFDVTGRPLITICVICLFFMWMETSLGICAGCKIYNLLLDYRIIPQPKHKPACPWWVCAVPYPTTHKTSH
jgi:hypothetical protein